MDMNSKLHKENEDRVAEEYLSSLSDLTCNSKPLINMLTMLAEENIEYASVIVRVVEDHIAKVVPDIKLPILYLIDSIVKNVKSTYVQLFSQCIVNIFCGVFETVNEKVRERMYALRQTWNEVFSAQKLYTLDVKVKRLDVNWPITAQHSQPAIHVNPNFLKTVNVNLAPNQTIQALPTDTSMEEILHAKTRKLLELKKQKLELELEATKKRLEEQEKQLGTAENVLSPVDTHILAPPSVMPQIMPNNMVAPNIVAHHSPAIRPSIYQNTYRHSRPNLIPGSNNLPAQTYPTGINNIGKPKVHPVNPALINTIRHRDPRLARQNQQGQQGLQQHGNRGIQIQPPSNYLHHNEDSKNTEKTSSYRKDSHKTRRTSSGGSGSESKSPTRHSSSRSGRTSSKSSSSSSRDKDRKRSDKNSSSSSGSGSSSDRRKDGGFSSRDKRIAKCDKDEFDITSNSSTHKRKSSSPASPPAKSKEVKRDPRSRSNSNKNRSPSPISGLTKDTDLRSNNDKRIKCNAGHTEKEDIKSSNAAKDLDKTSSIITNKKIDAINSKSENQVDKALKLNASENAIIKEEMEIDNDGEDVKKRPFPTPEAEEPLPKKSKSTKIDALFGSEDVDLRTVIPVILPTQKHEPVEEKVTPTLKSEDENLIHQNAENIDKTEPQIPINATETKSSPNKASTLDDVRAKLAKAAKFNKSGKFEKSHKELSQRLKLTELNINEDSQEANDEKLRTILAQAQELFEMKSVSQDQYKSLVQTVMSINEKNKLKEAKRKELVNTHKSQTIEDDDAMVERNTAREAILKKRIPKLVKNQSNNNELPLENSLGDSNASNSPLYDEKTDDINITKSRYNKEKRSKSVKWNDHDSGMQMNMPPNRPWLSGNVNKRHFRSLVPHPPMPPLPNPNLHLPQMPWQMGTGMPVPPFGNAIPPMMISKVPPPPQPPVSFNIAPASVQQSKKPCNSIDNPQENLVRTITIDSCAKEIRIYDEVAIVFMEMDQPREIRFQPGQRSISIDDETFAMHFNDDYKVVTIKGEPHRMKFGFPSRELYIDDQWYEIFFGGSIIPVPIGKNIRHLQAEGPPPKVNIGPIRRDLVIGKITMIVDAHIVIGIFIDAKLQTFNLGEKQHTIQFADNLLTVLLDGVAADVEFGGLPKSYELGDDKHFIRFSALPEDVEPGKIKIQNMRYVNTNPTETISVETNDSENLVETTASPNQNQSTITPPNTTTESIEVKSEENISTTNDGVVPTNTSVPSIPTDVLSKINIDELLQKLVSTGLLTSTTTSSSTNSTQNSTVKEELTNPDVVEEPIEVIRPIDLAKPETIKLRQSAIVATLFSGMQCSSCGVRFPPEQTIKYSQHLDWHFRQNRRERDSTRKAHSRKWYYELNDWAQYEEIEDLEEREKNFFETQLNEIDANDDVSNQRSINSPAPSCPAGANDVDRCCDMCHEKFEQFYNEEHEEWHLRSAIRVEDKIYHPLCYEDYKTALNPPKVEELKEDSKITEEDDNAVDNVIKITVDEEAAKLSVTIADDEEDDDDDVIVLPNEEPSVTEIVDDDEEYVPANVSREEMAISTDSKSDDKFIETVESDVEIEEPNIPFTDLDTYVEKEPTECDETSQLSFMNVKIKEEPKDEEDDDGFEDVGTVLIRPDEEISVQSSEETQTQTIASTASPATERRPSTESLTLTGIIEPLENTASMDLNISIDGNLEPDVGHNLSISGPTPAIPLSNLVNKIKINITKNTVSTNSNVSVSSSIITTSSSSTSHNNSSNLNSEVNDVNKNSLSHGNISTIQTINTIPVLCGGGATISTIASVVSSNPSKSVNESSKSSNNTALTSNTSDNSTVLRCPQSMSPTTASQRSSPPIEETIKFDFKPELQNVTLKKTKKVECGIETSGLCSIM
ncbi:uncharacterized protein LOC119686229 isoform X2 [Teleopsis dalmanni]|uniref:uncharacterized protein LOC119686229 isoform X2 n=1 Tax=Teleopsis dalmanni TaxID=139649 RepID=UPI0018CCC366|nr:uncharacterized protein LOC119686229 isoform X2 [Teleopsis dalmanni]